MPLQEKSPKGTPALAHESDNAKIRALIDEIDSLAVQQMAIETRRQESVDVLAASHREIDLAQDLLHTSLQRMADLDDDMYHARNMLSSKMKTLEVLKAKTQ